VGGSRAHHYQELFSELGMRTVSAGYEFAHRDDYEGRRVLPDVKVDADSRNIEELTVTADETRFIPRKDEQALARLEAGGLKLSEYEGMMAEMDAGALVIDDISQYETDRLIAFSNPISSVAGSRRNTPSRSTAYRSSSCTTMTTAVHTRDSRGRSISTRRSIEWSTAVSGDTCRRLGRKIPNWQPSTLLNKDISPIQRSSKCFSDTLLPKSRSAVH
jgi:hypothetical protein